MILFIDTSDFNNLTLALITKSTIKKFTTSIAFNENYKTNEYLKKFLKHHKIPITAVQKVVVCSGPGSFTGIRVGASLSQALGFALHIPVVAIRKNHIPANLTKLISLPDKKEMVLHYGAKPNITMLKKKKRAV